MEDPIESTFVNFDTGTTLSGLVNWDYKKEDFGKWYDSSGNTSGKIEDLRGSYYCMKVDSFFKVIVPTGQRGHDVYESKRNR